MPKRTNPDFEQNIFKNLWNDPVWSKVIASIIFAIITATTTYFLKLWPMIGGVINDSSIQWIYNLKSSTDDTKEKQPENHPNHLSKIKEPIETKSSILAKKQELTTNKTDNTLPLSSNSATTINDYIFGKKEK